MGSWHHAFDILSSVAIVTNTALIAMQPSVREYFSAYTDVEYILIFVAAEVKRTKTKKILCDLESSFQHVLLALRFAIDFAIPDVPYDIQIARAKNVFESNLALRDQVKSSRSRETETASFRFVVLSEKDQSEPGKRITQLHCKKHIYSRVFLNLP